MSIKKGVQTLGWYCLLVYSSISVCAVESSNTTYECAHVLNVEDITTLDFDDFVSHAPDMATHHDSIVFKNVARSGFQEQCKAIGYSVYVMCFMAHQWLMRIINTERTHKVRA